jgi:hypothetical protein
MARQIVHHRERHSEHLTDGTIGTEEVSLAICRFVHDRAWLAIGWRDLLLNRTALRANRTSNARRVHRYSACDRGLN